MRLSIERYIYGAAAFRRLKIMSTLRSAVVLLWTTVGIRAGAAAQSQPYFADGRDADPVCRRINAQLADRPKEVRFGVHINSDGYIYFSTNNAAWLNKFFLPGMAVTADIISMDRYDCGHAISGTGVIKGFVLPPVSEEKFRESQTELVPGYLAIRIGRIPAALRKKELEANLVVLYQDKIAFYSRFFDIPESVLDILPMGLFTDSLVRSTTHLGDSLFERPVTYEQVTRLVVPFAKNRADIDVDMLRRIYDSLRLDRALIKMLEIRAYTSVEGPEAINKRLAGERAKAVIRAWKKFQPGLNRISVQTGEDWLEFNQGLPRFTHSSYASLSKAGMKLKLLDPVVADSLETILATERKVVVTVYFERKSAFERVKRDSITGMFRRAIAAKNIGRARMIQKEIFERIRDNRLPADFLNRLEVPQTVDFWELQFDRISYSYWLTLFDEREALEALGKIRMQDSTIGRVNYNICALNLVLWHWFPDSTRDTVEVLGIINRLEGQGIYPSLVKRMKVNYYILMSQDFMAQYKYEQKDAALSFIRKYYVGMSLTDVDRYSLAQCFSFYAQPDWAMEMIESRIDQLDVSDDLLFYYINLCFFRPAEYGSDRLRKAMVNASNLDRARFCRFFHSIDAGGAGMQLLEEPFFRDFFCEDCRSR